MPASPSALVAAPITAPHGWRRAVTGDFGVLILPALLKLSFHALSGNQYGFHRDELGMRTDARYLDWGYVTYPPPAPLGASVARALFGETLWGLRFYAAFGQSVALVVGGLTARELGGAIHTRDIRSGRTEDFLPSQFYQATNPITVPLWIAGLFFYFQRIGRQFRLLGWMAVAAFVLLLAAVMLPPAPINSAWWDAARALYPEPREQLGWHEMVSDLEALHQHGAPYNLPPAASNQNTNWMRFEPGGMEQPSAYIVAAWPDRDVMYVFSGCKVAGRMTNQYSVANENSRERPNIYVCTGARRPWPQFWEDIRASA